MTFRRYIQITVLAIAGNIYLPVSGQENLLREFDAFINKENKTFDNRIKQMNKEFADYLEREWIGFPTYTNQPLSIDPDTFFIKKEETKNRKEEIDIPLEKNNDIRSEAGQLIIDKDRASIGMLQRMFKIGFNRAARIMDQLAEAGVVGPEEGTKPRKVLMSKEEFDAYIAENK